MTLRRCIDIACATGDIYIRGKEHTLSMMVFLRVIRRNRFKQSDRPTARHVPPNFSKTATILPESLSRQREFREDPTKSERHKRII